MIADAVVITHTANLIVGIKFISEDCRTLINELTDDRQKSSLVGLFYNHSTNVGHKLFFALSIDDSRTLHHTKDRSLGLGGTALCVWGTHRLMLPLLLTTNVNLIALYFAFKSLRVILSIESTNLLKHIPSSLLSDLDVTR